MYQIKLDKFEGPLDLLLRLIEEEKLDITEVSLAKVTGEYLNYLNETQDIPTDEMADFLVVAAKLLLIKSKILLPNLNLEGEEEGDLEKQLKIYRIFFEAAKKIHKIISRKKFAYFRESAKLRNLTPIFSPPPHLVANQLKQFFVEILGRIEPIIKLPQEVIKKTVSIQEKINEIKNFILEKETLSFQLLLEKTRDKTEIIVTFLALLELVKQRTIQVVQKNNFSEIYIKKNHQETVNY